jgi:hypothetical protein
MPDGIFTPLFAYASDLHLRPYAWAKHPTLCGDAYESFRQIVDHCVEHELNLVLGGDIFDEKRPDSHSVRFFGQQATRLFAVDRAIMFVQGDHDYHPDVPWPTVPGIALPIHGMQVKAGPFNLYGLDWTTRDRLPAALETIPAGTDILVTHQAWGELQGIGQTEGQIADIPHIRYLVTGDYHVTLQTSVQRPDGSEIKVFSAGSTCMQAVNERPEKSFFVFGHVDGVLTARVEPLVTRFKFDLIYNNADELYEDLEHGVIEGIVDDPRLPDLPEVIRKPILRVTFNDTIPDARDRIALAAGDRLHFFPNPRRVVQDVTISLDAAPGGAFDTLLSVCARLAPDPITYQDSARLLRAAEHGPEAALAELNTMYAEFQQQFTQPVPGDRLANRGNHAGHDIQ